MLTDSGLFDPPDNGAGWPVFVATERLARQFPVAVAGWLNQMYSRLSGNTKCVSMIGDAALAIGDIGLPLVARIVRQHSSEPDVLRLSWDAAQSANPTLDAFELFVDVVFNQKSSEHVWTFGEIAERLVSGIDSNNARRRVQLLAFKIRSTPDDDLVRSWHEYKPDGSIADRYDSAHDDRFDVLIHALMRGTRSALQWVEFDSLLEIMDTLPGMIGMRMRLWLLGSTSEVGVGVLIEEISSAIAKRRPNGDDLALIDRVIQTADPRRYEGCWRDALGPAPDVEDVGRALAANEPNEEWIRAFYWIPLLTGIAGDAWDEVLAVLSARYGSRSRKLLEAKSEPTRWGIVGDDSPFGIDELTTLSPEDACRRITGWRPQQGEWRVTALGLSETLERVVIDNPAEWTRHPLRIAMALRHPTYIHRYLVAVRATLADSRVPVDELIRLIRLLRAHPWKANELGPDKFDYDTNWKNVDCATIDLIESLAKKDIGFAGLSNQVWTILESAVRTHSDVPDEDARIQRDPLDTAINLPWTRALIATLEFMAHEFRSTDRIRPEAFRLLDETLRLDGDDGLYHRAIIAPNIGLLRHIAPEWVDSNRDLLLGSEAPDGLGQKTLDQALKWSQPNRWLLEAFPCGVMDAVSRQVKYALAHYLIALLWGWRGYALDDAAKFLGSQPELLSAAGERLGFLLDSDTVKQCHIERAVQFWRVMIDKTCCVDGLAAFGEMARVAALDDSQWLDLTVRTLKRTNGRIDQAYMVAERAAGMGSDEFTLDLMDTLVRRSSSIQSDGKPDRRYYHTEWAQKKVEDAARELLDRSADLRDSDHYQRLRTALLERRTDMIHGPETLQSAPRDSSRSAVIDGTRSDRPTNRTRTPS